MPLSRLENFLKNVEGNILYVNPTDLDATDSIENQGNSLTRPFKTIQRALLEASRFSYQIGQDNDKFDRTTVLLYPGEHEIDNRPGYNVVPAANGTDPLFRDRLGNVKTDLTELTDSSNYNLDDPDNVLYKYNSVEGGVIVPRGVSLAGYDVRKTKIRPKFVPDPENLAVTRSAIFRLTGGCHFWAVSFFDANPKTSCYKDYTTNRHLPQFSHHKLTVFEYADGVNGVGIGTSTVTTDLQMYFNKVQKAFGDSSGRPIADFPVNTDMQPKLPEYEITGPVNINEVGITSIRAGTGANPSSTITVRTGDKPHGLVVDSAIRIAGVSTYPEIYNGNFTVTGVGNSTEFTYEASSVPPVGLPSISNTEVILPDTDNVTGSSPYIFHCSLRSAYGMCGLHADGSKSAGFRSMLVAQFTGIGLQKDNNAFLVYNKTTGQYDTNATAADSEKPLYLNGKSLYRPSYKNAHIKTSNNAFVQAVSVFAVGFAEHFTTASGGDMSITNSNSNFGAVALNAKGFKGEAFNKDNRGFITHIIPPQNQFRKDAAVEWEAIDVTKTLASTVNQEQIHLDGFTDPAIPPIHVVNGYRLGARAKVDGIIRTDTDLLHVSVAGVGTYSAEIVMQNKTGGSGDVSIKKYTVERTGAINSITDSKITLTANHQLNAGESIRVISDDGHLPDGIDTNTIYYAITNDSTLETLNNNQIKLARSKNDALLGGSGNFITINNNKGGVLSVESRVSDKKPGDLGHPIQYNSTKGNWYIQVKGTGNEIYAAINANSGQLGPRTGKTFVKRKEDTRSLNDKIYRLRYVIPKESSDARPPIPGYTLQESSTVGVSTSGEYTNNIPDVTVQRNLRILKSIDRDPNTGITTVVTEKPHNLILGDEVQFRKVQSSGNTSGTVKIGYNITRDIVGITSSKGFEVKFYDTNPGTYVDTSTDRSDNLPTVSRRTHKDTFTVYRSETIKAHDYQRQDGVYHLICIDSSVSPTVNEYETARYNQNITDLYPQFDADNFNMDPIHSASFALNAPMGKVVTNDLRGSLSKEFANNFIVGNRIGYAVTGGTSASNGLTTLYTNIQHGLNSIISLASPSNGSGYGSAGTLYNVHLTGGSGHGATVNATINGSGQVTAVTIVDGGSGYAKGETLTLRAGGNNSTVVIGSVHNNIGDALQIVGVGSIGNRYNSGYNGIHTITAVTPKSVTYQLDSGVSAGIHSYTTVGIHTGFFMLAGNAPRINSIVYSDADVGIATVTTDEPHGLSVNNPIKIVGAAQTIYNGEHLVYEKESTTKFSFKFVNKYTPATYTTSGGKAQVLPVHYAAKGGNIVVGDEKLAERQVPLSVGISTTLSNATWVATSTAMTLTSSAGFQKGDYVQVDDEIVRISSGFSFGGVATVLRGQLGSRAESHNAGSLVKKIRIMAVEKRRASVLRASGHTFEYLGFGPGNYSTSFPEKQEKILTREENFLAQSTIDNGGSVVYTGVNDAGDFHIGNKVVNSQDGTEATFNIPVPTTTGSGAESDSASGRLDVIFDSVNVREGLIIDGNNNTTVRINAPTTVTEKLTSSSTDGAEFVSIDLTGGLSPSRTITYTDTVPTGSSTLGDILFKSNPEFGGHLGWTYTTQGWKQFGLIATERDSDKLSLGLVGVGSTGAYRVGTPAGIDVRGGMVADYLLMTGISTFLGTTIFQNVTIDRLAVTGSLDVSGVSTFRKHVDVNAGVTVDQIKSIGVSTFTGQGNRVYMQYKAPIVVPASAVTTSSGNEYITKVDHGLTTNDTLTYTQGTTAIGGLTNGVTYRVVKVNDDRFQLRTGTSGAAIDLTSQGAGNHTFTTVGGNRFDETAASLAGSAVQLQVDQLKVVGVATFPSTINFSNTTVAGLSTVSGNVDFKSDLDVDGTATVGGNIVLAGTLNANGEVNLGNATSDTITATGRFDSDLVPSTDNTRDLGASSLEWKDLYLDGTANIDSLLADTAKIGDLTDNRVVIAGASGELEDSANLTFNGSTLALSGTFSHTGSTTHIGDVNMRGATSGRDILFDRSENKLRVNDNAVIAFGNESDTTLTHNNTDFYLDNDKGHIYIRNNVDDDDGGDIHIQAKSGEESVVCADDGGVYLYYNANWRLQTTDPGVTIQGNLICSGSVDASLNASQLTSGTVPVARLSGTATNLTANTSTYSKTSTDGGGVNQNEYIIAAPAHTNQAAQALQTNSNFYWNANTSKLHAPNFVGNVIAGTISASGQVDLNGHVNIGNATNDTVSITAAVNTHINPDATGNNRDLGNSVQKWRNVYGVNFYGDGTNLTNTGSSLSQPGSGTHRLVSTSLTSGTMTSSGTDSTLTFNYGTHTLSATNFAGNGSAITHINFAAGTHTGTVPTARLGSEVATNSKFLRGDSSWQEVVVAINNLTNAGDNRVITSTGGNGANAESNLTFSGSQLAVTGSITCTGDITAMTSDIRLKTNIQPIENAVAKLLKLNGFTYEHNELAESLGYERDGQRISGVSAQDVKEVLPEAVKPAPANADYMTVQYEKLVPLLIEAIKELKNEIEELKK